nr:tRNA uridine-5-carboxymethylaminomethyl(34) synthesis enzyme MnmG [Pseudobdellovibrionaceae bacterium]
MFTSRAEHRLVLREDNTLDRLAHISSNVGLMDSATLDSMLEIAESRKRYLKYLDENKVTPVDSTQKALQTLGSSVLLKPLKLSDLLRRPEISSFNLSLFGFDVNVTPEVSESVEIHLKYEGYVRRQMELINQQAQLENLKIPEDLIYQNIKGLSAEEVEKLEKVRPINLGQAQRISGVNPSAIQSLIMYIKKATFRSTSSL